MITDVTLTEFQTAYRDLSEKDRGRSILVEEHSERFGWWMATFIVNQELVEIPPEEIDDFYNKYRSKNIFRLKALQPDYLKIYRDDSDDIGTVQMLCKKLVDGSEDKDNAERIAKDIVGYYRLSERAGNSVADMLEETEKALAQYEGLNGRAAGEELLDDLPMFIV